MRAAWVRRPVILYIDPVAVAGVIATVVTGFGAVWLQNRHPKSDAGNSHDNSVAPQADSPLESHLERLLKSRKLTIGAVKHPPLSDYQFTSSGIVFSGLYVELAKLVAARMGLKAEFKPVSWSEIPHAFDAGELDLVVSVFDTQGRRKTADFVAPFHSISLCGVVLRSSDKVSELGDLSNPDVRVAVTSGEAADEVVRELRIPKSRVLAVASQRLDDMMALVETGRADVALVDSVTGRGVENRNFAFEVVMADGELGVSRNAIMVPKGDDAFAAEMDELFTKARQDVLIQELEEEVLAECRGSIKRFRGV